MENIRKYDKEGLARRWQSAKRAVQRVKEETEESMKKTGVSATFAGSTLGLRYLWQRRKLAGKSNHFDKKKKANAYVLPGLAAAVFGITPLAGDAGPYLAAAGTGAMVAGSIDAVDEMAQEHHNKK